MRGGKGGHDTLAHSGPFPEDILGRASRSGGQTGENGPSHLQMALFRSIFYFILFYFIFFCILFYFVLIKNYILFI
jgi:hypothetical protein